MAFSDVIKLVRRWWWIVFTIPILAAVSAYLLTSTMTPIYRASATLVVQGGTTPGNQSLQDLQAAQQQSTTYSKLITTRPVLTEVIKRLNLPMSPEALARKVSSAPVRDTQLVTVSVSDPDPQLAAAIANTISQVFIEQNQAQQQALTGSFASQLDQNIADIKKRVDDTTAQITQLQATPNADAARLGTLRQQLIQDQSTYGSLLQARQQMAISAAQISGQVRMAEQAVPPLQYVSPRKSLNVMTGAMLGLLLAGGLVFVLDYLDDTVKTSSDVEAATGRPALGAIPRLKTLDATEALQHPRSLATESLRDLRTNVQFATAHGDTRSILVTSIRPGDGKTTLITNLAIVFAQAGQRVILVDGDLRKPRIHRQFSRVSNRQGLTPLLIGKNPGQLRAALQPTNIDNLVVLPSGPLPPNPPDLLGAQRMKEVLLQLEQLADIVLIDAPPLAISDPIILAGLADAVILVAWSGKTRADELAAAIQRVQASGTPLLGVVLNRLNAKGHSYYYYHAYYEDATPPGSNGGSAAPARSQRDSGGRTRLNLRILLQRLRLQSYRTDSGTPHASKADYRAK